jgi:hypothetical protein
MFAALTRVARKMYYAIILALVSRSGQLRDPPADFFLQIHFLPPQILARQ